MTCCRCTSSRRCKNSRCKKNDRKCVDCMPTRLGRCENGPELIVNPAPHVTAQETSAILDENHVNGDSSNRQSPPPLPSFIESSSTQFQWHDSGTKYEDLIQNINNAYDE